MSSLYCSSLLFWFSNTLSWFLFFSCEVQKCGDTGVGGNLRRPRTPLPSTAAETQGERGKAAPNPPRAAANLSAPAGPSPARTSLRLSAPQSQGNLEAGPGRQWWGSGHPSPRDSLSSLMISIHHFFFSQWVFCNFGSKSCFMTSRAVEPAQVAGARRFLPGCSFRIAFAAAECCADYLPAEPLHHKVPLFCIFQAGIGTDDNISAALYWSFPAKPATLTLIPAHLMTSTGITVSTSSAPLARMTRALFEAIFMLYF